MNLMKLFNRSFFKFTLGFISLVLVGLLGVFAAGFRDTGADEPGASALHEDAR